MVCWSIISAYVYIKVFVERSICNCSKHQLLKRIDKSSCPCLCVVVTTECSFYVRCDCRLEKFSKIEFIDCDLQINIDSVPTDLDSECAPSSLQFLAYRIIIFLHAISIFY